MCHKHIHNLQSLSNISIATAQSPEFQSTFIMSVAASLHCDPKDIQVSEFSFLCPGIKPRSHAFTLLLLIHPILLIYLLIHLLGTCWYFAIALPHSLSQLTTSIILSHTQTLLFSLYLTTLSLSQLTTSIILSMSCLVDHGSGGRFRCTKAYHSCW